MTIFNLDFSIISIVALCIAFIAAMIALGPGMSPQRRTGKEPQYIEPADPSYIDETDSEDQSPIDSDNPESPSSQEQQVATEVKSVIIEKTNSKQISNKKAPLVSVIAYTPDYSESLDEFIDSISKQDYPRFELILVLDAGVEVREMLVEKYLNVPGLYLTFIPPGSQNLSRRKLAITIGMKAAKGEVAVLTSSICHIPSEKWLSGMMSQFIENQYLEVALGFCRTHNVGARGLKGLWRRWFSANTAMQWIGYALEGKAYRGDGYNLALRRSTFFNHKGFAQTVNIHCGEEDLFVNEITNAANTRMILDSDTILTVDWGEAASKMWIDRRESHDFTSRWLPRGPFRRSAMLSWCQWLMLLGCVGGAIASLPNLLPAALAILLFVLVYITEVYVWSRGYRAIAPFKKWWSTPFFILWKPIGNRLFRWRHRSERLKNYTWQNKRRRG
ncbi:MAG: hypothetical protein HDS82_01955 [Bacteroidales bacterium]|nr:hypothetical protein [Bacteroidales bacterium]